MIREVDSREDKCFSLMDSNQNPFLELENLLSLHACYKKWRVGVDHTLGEVEMTNLVDVPDGSRYLSVNRDEDIKKL